MRSTPRWLLVGAAATQRVSSSYRTLHSEPSHRLKEHSRLSTQQTPLYFSARSTAMSLHCSLNRGQLLHLKRPDKMRIGETRMRRMQTLRCFGELQAFQLQERGTSSPLFSVLARWICTQKLYGRRQEEKLPLLEQRHGILQEPRQQQLRMRFLAASGNTMGLERGQCCMQNSCTWCLCMPPNRKTQRKMLFG